MDHNKSGITFLEAPPVLNSDEAKIVLRAVIENEGFIAGKLAYNFVPREKIIEINQTYLNHNYATDIITFNYVEGNTVNGEVFICPEEVFSNAEAFQVSNQEELKRVVIHGALHLIGYNDQMEQEQEIMRKKEDEGIAMWNDKMTYGKV